MHSQSEHKSRLFCSSSAVKCGTWNRKLTRCVYFLLPLILYVWIQSLQFFSAQTLKKMHLWGASLSEPECSGTTNLHCIFKLAYLVETQLCCRNSDRWDPLKLQGGSWNSEQDYCMYWESLLYKKLYLTFQWLDGV